MDSNLKLNLMLFSSTTVAKTKTIGREYPELMEEVGEEDAAYPAAWHSPFVSFLGIYPIDILILVHKDVLYADTHCSIICNTEKLGSRYILLLEGNRLRSTWWNNMLPPKMKWGWV